MVDLVIIPWFQRLAEPVRTRQRHSSLEHFSRSSVWFGIATSPFLRDWYRPFSEPVRNRPQPPRGAPFNVWPYFFLPHIDFALSVTETADSASFSFIIYGRKNLARVSITEVQVYTPQATVIEVEQLKTQVSITEIRAYTAQVTIREIVYARGYS